MLSQRFSTGLLWVLSTLSVIRSAAAFFATGETWRGAARAGGGTVLPTPGAGAALGPWPFVSTALNWIVMATLDAVFLYLLYSARYARHRCAMPMPQTSRVPHAAATSEVSDDERGRKGAGPGGRDDR